MSSTILSVRNLQKTYDNGTQALKGVSFDVKKGEFLVIIGLSGSGKSTLLRCLNRLHDPTSGEIMFNNQDIAKVQGQEMRAVRKKIGMIFQHFNLVPRYSVLKNVLMGRLGSNTTGELSSLVSKLWMYFLMGSISALVLDYIVMSALTFYLSFFATFVFTFLTLIGICVFCIEIYKSHRSEDIPQAMEYLSLVGIREKAALRADQLSGGQQQRVAIARALAQSPEVLLADEPVASLDPATSHSVMDYLKKVNQELGITVICNLHFLSLVRQYATRVIALKAGEIVFEGSPSEITETWFQKIYGEGTKEI